MPHRHSTGLLRGVWQRQDILKQCGETPTPSIIPSLFIHYFSCMWVMSQTRVLANRHCLTESATSLKTPRSCATAWAGGLSSPPCSHVATRPALNTRQGPAEWTCALKNLKCMFSFPKTMLPPLFIQTSPLPFFWEMSGATQRDARHVGRVGKREVCTQRGQLVSHPRQLGRTGSQLPGEHMQCHAQNASIAAIKHIRDKKRREGGKN